MRTLPVGVATLREEGTGARWHIIMAGSMFVVAPVLLVFVVAQCHLIRAFTFTHLHLAEVAPGPARPPGARPVAGGGGPTVRRPGGPGRP